MTGLAAISAHLLCPHHLHIAYFLCFGMNLLTKHYNGWGRQNPIMEIVFIFIYFLHLDLLPGCGVMCFCAFVWGWGY